ncbi:MAG TPA: hypothetical protein VIR63_02820 [Pontiella sp.]
MENIDLKKEQQISLERPRPSYSLPARFFFLSMDLLTGKKITLPKTLLIELLASIPYRAWELRMYAKLTLGYRNREVVEQALRIMEWSREAQDNEYWHVVAIQQKMKEDGVKGAWYLLQPIPFFMIAFYILFTRTLALFNLRRAFIFNAEFEDHAEHVYAQFVQDNPQWEEQQVTSPLVLDRMPFDSWADVFRRIGLDEREHRNASFIEAGLPERVCPNGYDEA